MMISHYFPFFSATKVLLAGYEMAIYKCPNRRSFVYWGMPANILDLLHKCVRERTTTQKI